jgi:hypothetical protein
MAGPKTDYPPLLGAGLHPMTMAQVQTLCVGGFPTSTTRGRIFGGLTSLLAELSAAGMTGNVWIDGSFVTQKIDPSDCDLVVEAPGIQVLDQGPPVLQKLLRTRFKAERAQTKVVYRCDAFLFPDYPVVHVDYGLSMSLRAYWLKQFGFDRAGKQPKGMAVVTLPVTP